MNFSIHRRVHRNCIQFCKPIFCCCCCAAVAANFSLNFHPFCKIELIFGFSVLRHSIPAKRCDRRPRLKRSRRRRGRRWRGSTNKVKPRFEWINRDLLYRQKISMDGMQKQEEINVLLNVGHIQLAIRLLQSVIRTQKAYLI